LLSVGRGTFFENVLSIASLHADGEGVKRKSENFFSDEFQVTVSAAFARLRILSRIILAVGRPQEVVFFFADRAFCR